MALTIQATSNDSKRWNIAITKKGFEEINSAKEVIKRVNDMIKKSLPKNDVESLKKVLNSFFHKFK